MTTRPNTEMTDHTPAQEMPVALTAKEPGHPIGPRPLPAPTPGQIAAEAAAQAVEHIADQPEVPPALRQWLEGYQQGLRAARQAENIWQAAVPSDPPAPLDELHYAQQLVQQAADAIRRVRTRIGAGNHLLDTLTAYAREDSAEAAASIRRAIDEMELAPGYGAEWRPYEPQ